MDMTILFSDIRSFTALSEKMTPEENFKFLNAFLRHISPVIRRYNGFIDKYIGDGVMALFPDSADSAVKSAVNMLCALRSYNHSRKKKQRVPVRVGIGINTGSIILGTVGENHRMETTVIADSVNLASRVEGLSKKFGVELLITEQTYSVLKDRDSYAIRFIGSVSVKGKEELVKVYEVFEADLLEGKRGKTKSQKIFEDGVKYYDEKKYSDALECFEQCVRIYPEDSVADVYVKELCN